MVTEPIEAIIAILLISIILYSVFVYNQRGTERLLMKRTLTRSIAGTVSGIYLNYINTTQIFRDFNESVANFLVYFERKENVSCSAALRPIFKNGSYFDYQLIKGKELVSSINESIVVAHGRKSGSLHIYAIVNRTFISSYYSRTPVSVYVIAYYDNGIPALGCSTREEKCISVVVDNGISTQCGLYNGKATCDISGNYQNVSSKEVKIDIYCSNIDGEYSRHITFNYPVSYKPYIGNPTIYDTSSDGKPYLHYYLGEIVNFTTDVSSWKISNRKGEVCKSNTLGNKIPTGSNYPCVDAGNIPLPIFLVQGPVNITLNYNSNEEEKSNQVIFIDPYFTEVLVRIHFRG